MDVGSVEAYVRDIGSNASVPTSAVGPSQQARQAPTFGHHAVCCEVISVRSPTAQKTYLLQRPMHKQSNASQCASCCAIIATHGHSSHSALKSRRGRVFHWVGLQVDYKMISTLNPKFLYITPNKYTNPRTGRSRGRGGSSRGGGGGRGRGVGRSRLRQPGGEDRCGFPRAPHQHAEPMPPRGGVREAEPHL